MSNEDKIPPQKEVIEFWGSPSNGTFKRVAVVQDAVVIEPVLSQREEMEKVLKAIEENGPIEFSMPADPDVFPKKTVVEAPCTTGSNGKYQCHKNRDTLNEMVFTVLDELKRVETPYTGILVTGQSGLVPGAVAAFQLNKDLLVRRKPREDSHGVKFVGDTWFDGASVVIVDDFVSSGSTLMRLLQETTLFRPNKEMYPTVVGVVLYSHHVTEWEREHGYIQTAAMQEYGIKLTRHPRGGLLFTVTKEDA